MKPTLGLDFPNLPYYLDGDVAITQSDAILAHVARAASLDGSTPALRARAAMLLGLAADLRSPCVRLRMRMRAYLRAHALTLLFIRCSYVSLVYNNASFDAARAPFVDGTLAPMIASLEAFATKSAALGPFLLGSAFALRCAAFRTRQRMPRC